MSEAKKNLGDGLKAAGELKAPDRLKAPGPLEVPDPTEKSRLIVEAALDVKAERPVALDMRVLTSYADCFIVLTGASDRQVRSIADAIIRALKADGDVPLGVEGLADAKWVLIDCNEVIVHVFDPETRVHFDLERLWRDAPRLDLEIEGVDPDPESMTEVLGEAELPDPAA